MSATPVGDELVVMHLRHMLTGEGRRVSVDIVVVWRIVDERVVAIWDTVSSDAREVQNG